MLDCVFTFFLACCANCCDWIVRVDGVVFIEGGVSDLLSCFRRLLRRTRAVLGFTRTGSICISVIILFFAILRVVHRVFVLEFGRNRDGGWD